MQLDPLSNNCHNLNVSDQNFMNPMITIRGDVNCLFSCFSYFLLQTEQYHKNIRMLIINAIAARWDFFKTGIAAENTYDVLIATKEDYVDYMSRDGTWGANPEILGFASLLSIYCVVIFMPYVPPIGAPYHQENKCYAQPIVYGNSQNPKLLLRLKNVHYDIIYCDRIQIELVLRSAGTQRTQS